MRSVPGPLIAAVLVLGTVLGAGACQSDAPVRTDRKEAHSRPAPFARGPAPGTFERVWRTPRIEGGGEPQIVAGRLLVHLEDGVRAYDSRTGRPTWHYREPGRDLEQMASTGGVLVLETRSRPTTSKTRVDRVVGVDLATGRVEWQNADAWSIEGDSMASETTDDNAPKRIEDAAAADGVVVMAAGEDKRLGIDARTGEVRWEISRSDLIDEPCLEPKKLDGARASDRRAAVVHVDMFCPADRDRADDSDREPRRGVLAALDARTGGPRWSEPLQDTGESVVRNGIVLYQESNLDDAVILDRNGRTILSTFDDCVSGCELYVSGNSAAVTSAAPASDAIGTVVVDIRRRSGPAERHERFESGGGWIPDHAGRLYQIRRLRLGRNDPNHLPRALSVLDLSAARSRTPDGSEPSERAEAAERQSPVPVVGSDERLIGVAGGLFYTSTQDVDGPRSAFRISAYARNGGVEPTELGGLRTTDWPDACKLLAGIEKHPYLYAPEPLTIRDHRIHHSSCRSHSADLDVVWVGRRTEEVTGLIEGGRTTVEGADEVEFLPREENGSPQYRRALIRVGRVIVAIGVDSRSGQTMDRVLPIVAENLRRRT